MIRQIFFCPQYVESCENIDNDTRRKSDLIICIALPLHILQFVKPAFIFPVKYVLLYESHIMWHDTIKIDMSDNKYGYKKLLVG